MDLISKAIDTKSDLKSNKSWFYDSTATFRPGGWGYIPSTYDYFGGQQEPSKNELIKAYDDIAYAVISLIAQNISQIPIRLFVKTATGQSKPTHLTRSIKGLKNHQQIQQANYGIDVREVVEHPLLDLLKHPNDHHDLHDFLELISIYMECTGNAYVKKWQSLKHMPPDRLFLVPSQAMSAERDRNFHVIRWIENQGGETITHELKDIIHVKFANPSDPYGMGYPPLRGAWGRRQISAKELSYLDNYLGNQGKPDAVLSIKDSFSPVEAERISKEFRSRYQGQGNGGLLVVDGTMNLQPLNFPARDLAELQLYQVLKTSICNCFKVPPDLFELGTSSNRSTRESALYAFASQCLQPRINNIVQKLNNSLVKYYDDRLFLMADNIVPEDKEYELQVEQMLLGQQVVTRDEVRQRHGYCSEEWAKEPLLPSGVMPATHFADTQPQEQEQEEAPQAVDRTSQAQAVLALQQAVYRGELPREAGLSQLQIIYGFSPEEAQHLLPPAPQAPAPQAQETKSVCTKCACGCGGGTNNKCGGEGGKPGPCPEAGGGGSQAPAAPAQAQAPATPAKQRRESVERASTTLEASSTTLDQHQSNLSDTVEAAQAGKLDSMSPEDRAKHLDAVRTQAQQIVQAASVSVADDLKSSGLDDKTAERIQSGLDRSASSVERNANNYASKVEKLHAVAAQLQAMPERPEPQPSQELLDAQTAFDNAQEGTPEEAEAQRRLDKLDAAYEKELAQHEKYSEKRSNLEEKLDKAHEDLATAHEKLDSSLADHQEKLDQAREIADQHYSSLPDDDEEPEPEAPEEETPEPETEEEDTRKAVNNKTLSDRPSKKHKSPEPLIKAISKFFQRLSENVSLPEEIKSVKLQDFFDVAKWSEEMYSELKPIIESYYDHGAKEVITTLNLSPSMFKVVAPNLKKGADKSVMMFCTETMATTNLALKDAQENLRKEIADGLITGEVKNQLKDRVQKVFENASTDRAFTIGVTEASRAQHHAMIITAQESGVVKGKKWLCSKNACPICKQLSNKTVALNEPFTKDGSGVYSEITAPPRHPNCLCNLLLETI